MLHACIHTDRSYTLKPGQINIPLSHTRILKQLDNCSTCQICIKDTALELFFIFIFFVLMTTVLTDFSFLAGNK